MHDTVAPRKAITPSRRPALAFIALLAGNIALAFGPWLVRLADTGPVAAGFWRIALAAPLLLLVARLSGGKAAFRGARGFGWLLGGAGVLFAADLAAWHIGIHHTKLANATLFGNCASLVFPLYGFVAARAWPTRQQGVALLLALAGALLLLGRSAQLSPEGLIGDLACLLAGLFYAGYFIAMARVRAVMAPLPSLALSSLAGALPLLLAALALGERIMPADWTPLILLALCSQVIGQGLMIFALGEFSPLVIGLALLTQPIAAATIGWTVYGERLGIADVVGGVMVALALVLVRRAPADDKEAP